MTTTDTRHVGLRALNWVGVLVLVAMGLPLTGLGLLGLGSDEGRGLLCGGLLLLVSAAAGVAREVVEVRSRHRPAVPRLEMIDGESALHLPRAAGPTLISSGTLLGLAVVAALGAVFTALAERWGWVVVLTALAVWLGGTSGIRHGSRLAGGLWLTPTRVRHEDRGVAVEAPWETVTGVVPQQPMPILLRTDRPVAVTRTGPRGRAWRPVSRDGNTLLVDTRHLAGGHHLASYVIAKAITDPTSRAILGTRESLPPA